MIEIFVIITLSKNIKKIVVAKGLKPAKYIILMVFLWIFLEISGAVIGVLLFGEGLASYPFALIGAALGGFIGYRVAKAANLPVERNDILDTDVI